MQRAIAQIAQPTDAGASTDKYLLGLLFKT